MLTPEAVSFIEDFGLLITEGGLPRSMGRVLGLLLICDPHQQSALQIQQQLQLSSGSVSAATTFLYNAGFIKRSSRSGSRRLFYEVDEACWQRVVQSRLHQLRHGVSLAERALSMHPADPRLLSMHHLYSEFERTLSQMKL